MKRASLLARASLVLLTAWFQAGLTAGVMFAPIAVQAQAGATSSDVNGLHLLGVQSYRRGQYAEAAAQFERERAALIQQLGSDHPDTLRSMVNLADSFGNLGRDVDALKLREEVLERRRVNLGPDHPDTLRSMNDLGLMSYLYLGRTADGLKLMEQSLALRRVKLGLDHPDTLEGMDLLATTYDVLIRDAEAVKLREETMVLRRGRLGADHPDTLFSMHVLAGSYANIGRAADALGLRLETLRLRQSGLGRDHPDTLFSMAALAGSYSSLGRHAEAVEVGEGVLALRRRRLGPGHRQTLNSMVQLAHCYRALGRFSAAIDLLEQALVLRRAALRPNEHEAIDNMRELALAYQQVGRAAEAMKLQEETLASYRFTAGPSHPDTLRSMGELASSYADRNRMAEARPLRREALAIIDRFAAGYQLLSREERSTALAQFRRDYVVFARELADDTDAYPEAFSVIERGKARSLLEELTARQAISSSGIPDAVATKLSGLRSQLESLDGRLSVGTGDVGGNVGLRADRDRVKGELDSLQSILVAEYPRYAAMTAVHTVSLKQGSALLPINAVFVSWMLDDASAGVVLSLAPSGSVKVMRANLGKSLTTHASSFRWLTALPTGTEFAAAVRTGALTAWLDAGLLTIAEAEQRPANAELVQPSRYMALREAALAAHGQWLAEVLLNPLETQIAGVEQWILSPDGVLATLPWDMLPFNGKRLGAQKQITLVQSLSIYKLLKDREAEYLRNDRTVDRLPLLAVGGAIYDADATAVGCSDRRSGRSVSENVPSKIQFVTSRDGRANGPAPDVQISMAYQEMLAFKPSNLPCSLDEVDSVSALIGGQKLTKADATETKLRQMSEAGSLARFRRLHFAVHGILNTSFPSLSAILLGRTGNEVGNDGFITAGEWPAFNLKSDLLVMSACETGVGKIISGEGVQGLPYALYLAGNRDTLLTLWPIDDEGASVFMRRFWAKLKAGRSHAEALVQTKREFMSGQAGGQFVDPFYWAPFVLYGLQGS